MRPCMLFVKWGILVQALSPLNTSSPRPRTGTLLGAKTTDMKLVWRKFCTKLRVFLSRTHCGAEENSELYRCVRRPRSPIETGLSRRLIGIFTRSKLHREGPRGPWRAQRCSHTINNGRTRRSMCSDVINTAVCRAVGGGICVLTP